MRRIRPLLAAALLSLSASGLAAQGNDAIHAEVFGPAILGSVNYERVVGGSFSGRVGVGWLPGFDIGSQLQVPLMVNVLAGKGVHRVEVGGGAVLAYALSRGIEEAETVRPGWRRPHAAATLAYRLEPGEASAMHGGIYRVGLTPLFVDGRIYPSIVISAGAYLSAFGDR